MASPAGAALKGSCKCGYTSYTTDSLPRSITHCHCKTCQKASGALFLSWGSVSDKAITWSSTDMRPRQSFKLENTDLAFRGYCIECQSPLFMSYHGSRDTYIAMGSVDEVVGELVDGNEHIFLKDRPAWSIRLDDSAKKFEGFPPDFAKRLEELQQQRNPRKSSAFSF